jgi:hypothetical protein
VENFRKEELIKKLEKEIGEEKRRREKLLASMVVIAMCSTAIRAAGSVVFVLLCRLAQSKPVMKKSKPKVTIYKSQSMRRKTKSKNIKTEPKRSRRFVLFFVFCFYRLGFLIRKLFEISK